MIYFISDVHLGVLPRPEDSPREEILLAFLDKIAPDCKKLYILGDLFDYWFEYKSVIPKYFYRTLTKIKELKDRNIEIEYLMGNHDFGHVDFFRNEFAIEIHKDDIIREHDGKKFYLSHGDGKSNKDNGYKILKKILRNPISLSIFLKFHPDCGISVASSTSKKSRSYTDAKNYGKTEGMEEFAESQINNHAMDFVIMGHRHLAVVNEYDKGTYINLGEWIRQPHYAVWDGNKMTLNHVLDFLKVETKND